MRVMNLRRGVVALALFVPPCPQLPVDPCVAADLRPLPVAISDGDGAASATIRVRNDGADACWLGSDVEAALSDGATVLPVKQRDVPQEREYGGVAIEPGAVARADLQWFDWCGPTPVALGIRLTLPGDGALDVPVRTPAAPACEEGASYVVVRCCYLLREPWDA